jgi:lipocalin
MQPLLADLSIEYSVLDVVYSNYALLHACVNKRNTVWLLSRRRYLDPSFIDRAVRVMEANGLSIALLQEIEQACTFSNFF